MDKEEFEEMFKLTLWDRVVSIPYRIRDFFKDLYYNLKPKKLKRLFWFVRFNWNYWGYDFSYILQMMKFGIDELIKDYEEHDVYVGQDKDHNDLVEFREVLSRIIEDDYDWKSNDYNEDIEKFGELIKKIGNWWI